jgi:hypothetical protein
MLAVPIKNAPKMAYIESNPININVKYPDFLSSGMESIGDIPL